MQVRSRIKTSKPESKFDETLETELVSYSLELANILNAGLKFADNFNAQIKTFTTNAAANTEDAVAHTLKRVPTGFIIINRDKAGIVYDSGTSWTATNIYLKCSAAATAVKIMIF